MFEVQWKAVYLDGSSEWRNDSRHDCVIKAIKRAESEAKEYSEIRHRVRLAPLNKTLWKSWRQ